MLLFLGPLNKPFLVKLEKTSYQKTTTKVTPDAHIFVLAIPLLKSTQHVYKEIHTWMLIVALFEIVEDQAP